MNDCEHKRVYLFWKLYACATLYEPEEYVEQVICQECGDELDSVPDEAEVTEMNWSEKDGRDWDD